MTDAQLLDAIALVVARGGSVTVEPINPRDRESLAEARIVTDVGLKRPTKVLREGATARDALIACFDRAGVKLT